MGLTPAAFVGISIHAPREGSDRKTGKERRATPYFYPRSPRGERRSSSGRHHQLRPISIHAPREGSDAADLPQAVFFVLFLSTLPARGATYSSGRCGCHCEFLSTLPARGATWRTCSRWARTYYFYPRSPRGERRQKQKPTRQSQRDFYPRSPRGERQQMC